MYKHDPTLAKSTDQCGLCKCLHVTSHLLLVLADWPTVDGIAFTCCYGDECIMCFNTKAILLNIYIHTHRYTESIYEAFAVAISSVDIQHQHFMC